MYRFFVLSAVWVALLFTVASGRGVFDRVYELNISSQAINPDCSNFTTQSLLINGQLPGPTLTAIKGERVRLIVRNLLAKSAAVNASNDVTIHIHGIRQYGTTQFDGVPFLSQQPIPPGEMFAQDFRVAKQSGTYFYHAHVGFEAQTVYGTFIVYESQHADPSFQKPRQKLQAGPHVYDEERTIIMSEWWHWDRVALEDYILGPTINGLPEPESLLINGRTRYLDNGTQTAPKDDGSCTGGYSVIPIETNKTYRLRVINAALFHMYAFGIAGHTLTVIEVDGDLVEPYQVEYLDAAPGQRISVLVHANQPFGKQDYAISTMQRYALNGNSTTNGFAVLRYVQDDFASMEHTQVWQIPPERATFPASNDPTRWVWSELKPVTHMLPPRLNGPPSRTITLRSTLGPLGNTTMVRWFVNDIAFVDPDVPILSRIFEDRRNGVQHRPPVVDANGFDRERGTYPARFLETVDIVLQTTRPPNAYCQSHPWHTHGHSHWEIAYGVGKYVEAEHGTLRNVPRPVHKDITLVYPPALTAPENTRRNATGPDDHVDCAWSKIRIVMDNPGVWAMHCHNTLHMTAGMMVVLEEAPELIHRLREESSYPSL